MDVKKCCFDTSYSAESSVDNSENMPMVWGQLVVIRRSNRRIDLNKMEFTVGREKCDLNLSTDEMSVEHLHFISRVHFKLKRDFSQHAPVYIQDLSRNGTFVNGDRVGRNNTRIIQNDDEIAIGSEIRKVFRFYDRFRVNDIPSCITDNYYISQKLGVGACGIVRLIFNKRTCSKYAMKQITKSKNAGKQKLNDPGRIMNEVNIMKKLHHPFIVNIYDVVDTPDAVFLILELMEGGDLYNRITKAKRLNETTSKHILYQLAVAVNYLHGKNITHRDLKPENILLQSYKDSGGDSAAAAAAIIDSDDDLMIVKLSDFGLSKLVDEGTSLRTECGTALYVAPEILRKDVQTYTDKVDVWSLGVILYVCISGCVPFVAGAGGRPSLAEQICRGRYTFDNHPAWRTVSPECRDLIARMLEVDPSRRLTCRGVLDHRWLQDPAVIARYSAVLNPVANCSSGGGGGVGGSRHDSTFELQFDQEISCADLERSLDVNCNNNTSAVTRRVCSYSSGTSNLNGDNKHHRDLDELEEEEEEEEYEDAQDHLRQEDEEELVEQHGAKRFCSGLAL